jgi:hypothetical protein
LMVHSEKRTARYRTTGEVSPGQRECFITVL